jgi:hypothetical protein
MQAPANLFRLLNEFIVLLLGALLILIAVTHTMGVPSRPSVLMILGVVFILWAARGWAQPAPKDTAILAGVRAGSLAIVGVLLVAIPLLSLGRAGLLLGIAGAVLVVRGIIGGVLSIRQI